MEHMSRASLSARMHICETYLRRHELSSKVNTLQGKLVSELSLADYQTISQLPSS